MTFTTNIGTADRMIRFVVGALLIVLTLTGTIGLWGWIGIILLATAFVKHCPAYSIFGIRTCARE